MTRSSVIIAALAAALLTGSVAHAAPESDTVQTKVSFSDLDLSTSQGVQTLSSRIKSASTGACDYLRDDAALSSIAQFNDCRRDFVAKAVAQVGSPMLTQVATGSSSPIHLASH